MDECQNKSGASERAKMKKPAAGRPAQKGPFFAAMPVVPQGKGGEKKKTTKDLKKKNLQPNAFYRLEEGGGREEGAQKGIIKNKPGAK